MGGGAHDALAGNRSPPAKRGLGAGGTHAALIRSRCLPCPQVARVAHAALARGQFFLPTGGPRCSGAQLEPPYPTGGRGHTLRSGPAGAASPAHRGTASQLMFDIKCQSELSLVDV